MKAIWILPLLLAAGVLNAALLPQPMTLWGVGDQTLVWNEDGLNGRAKNYMFQLFYLNETQTPLGNLVSDFNPSMFLNESLIQGYPDGMYKVKRQAAYFDGFQSDSSGFLEFDRVLDIGLAPSATIKLLFKLPLNTQKIKLRALYPNQSIHYFVLPPVTQYEMPQSVYNAMPNGTYVIQGAAMWGTKTYAYGNAVVHVKS